MTLPGRRRGRLWKRGRHHGRLRERIRAARRVGVSSGLVVMAY